jgi:arginyl-tRNA synthetase
MIKDAIRHALKEALRELSIEAVDFSLEPPEDISHGDYMTNVALAHAKLYKLNPSELGKRVVEKLSRAKVTGVEKIEVAGPGFINIHLSKEFIVEALTSAREHPERYGKTTSGVGVRAIYEYTDPNPFKEFHIGHLMSNTIGESLSRLAEFSGATVTRACYQGDMGLNVAQAVWGMERLKSEMPHDGAPLKERVVFLGKAYALGASGYEETEAIKEDIIEVNRKLFAKNDPHLNGLYEKGKKWSLESFEAVYAKLGTKFDHYFFESETAPIGVAIVNEFLTKGVFEKSDGAVIFKGEKYGLHTRVFINSEGFPTYDGKELGLAKVKYERSPYDRSVIITANEQAGYFKVLLKAIDLVFPELVGKNQNITHGMMKLSSGKMSSRKGNVVAGDALIATLADKVLERVKERTEIDEKERLAISETIAVAALKYSILKQSIGKDIVFDIEAALSFEGDSGPYLQYAAVRAQSVLRNATKEGITASLAHVPADIFALGKRIYRFPDVVARAQKESAPQYIATYLTQLAGEYNSFYANNKIVDKADPTSPFKVALTEVFVSVMRNGLWLLGVTIPHKM